ncbi:hypothetical protein GOBAR_AA38677 [Gossypium barbadense]|uniref:Uncharacterized protein n=1 Tax=Gossypium barbadense TaxID=3634 RepID=A0A2P5VT63_GOSBA|nr:hypothetical protein GOBAR_AA38677 [Gossypium barbadense]
MASAPDHPIPNSPGLKWPPGALPNPKKPRKNTTWSVEKKLRMTSKHFKVHKFKGPQGIATNSPCFATHLQQGDPCLTALQGTKSRP